MTTKVKAGVLDISGDVADSLLVLGTAVSASGTAIDFTDIPSWVKRITILYANLSTSGTNNILIQIGDSGGIENTGYVGTGGRLDNAAAVTMSVATTSGFLVATTAAANVMHGKFTLDLLDPSTNTWIATGFDGKSNAGGMDLFAYSKALTGTLDRLRITTVGGSDTFDSGTVNISYE